MPVEFSDTDVLVYAFTDDPKGRRAQELLSKGCVIGVQILNEFTHVARRELRMDWTEPRRRFHLYAVCAPLSCHLM